MTTYELSTDAAEYYESTFVPALFGAWARRLVDRVDPRPGQRVLDVACGTGVVARTVADRVAPGGEVVGLDRNPAMLAVAARIRPELRWELGDAAALPFGDGSFDGVLCQSALMFFPDPVAAVAEMARVVRPDGTVAVQVPGRLANSPGYLAFTEVVARHAGDEARRLLASYFAAGDPHWLCGVLRDAGLVPGTPHVWSGATRLDSVETFVDVELLPIADRVDADTRARIVRDCREALRFCGTPEGSLAAPIEVVAVLGQRPADPAR